MDLTEVGTRLEAERQRLGLMAVEVYEDKSVKIAQTTYKNYQTRERGLHPI